MAMHFIHEISWVKIRQGIYFWTTFFISWKIIEDVTVHSLFVPWDCHNIRRMFRDSCNSYGIHDDWYVELWLLCVMSHRVF